MRKLLLPLAIFALTLVGCGDEKNETVETAEQVKFSIQTDNAIVNQLLPAIRHLLPGLDRYANQFQDIHVAENHWLTIQFHIPDDAKIPNEYLAQGNNCFIEINAERTAVKVPKMACKSVAFNRAVQELDSDYWFYLPADQLAYKSYDFRKLNDKERIDIGVKYLKKVWDTVQMISQKTDWQPADFPNYGKLFWQFEHEGQQFVTTGDMFPAYGSCKLVGAYAQNWWSEQVSSLKDLSSNVPKKIASALKQIARAYDSYYESAVSCSKEIRQPLPVEKKMEILPPTSDNKPPRVGCLMVFTPDNKTNWSCPID